jgi:hypothetical protein
MLFMRTLICDILQVISGVLVTASSWILAQLKASTYISPPGSVMSPPPNFILEFVVVFFGFLIIICSYLQRRMQVKYASLQMIFGLIIAIISLPFGIRAATLGHGEYSAIYYVVYLLLVPGIAVSLIGIAQLINWLSNCAKVNSSK